MVHSAANDEHETDDLRIPLLSNNNMTITADSVSLVQKDDDDESHHRLHHSNEDGNDHNFHHNLNNTTTDVANHAVNQSTITTPKSAWCVCSFWNHHIDMIQLVAMIANYATSYNVVNISIVLPILKEVIMMNDPTITHISSEDSSIVASSLLFGMMLGQMIGGTLGDVPRIGPMNALRIVMTMQIVASVASSVFVAIDKHSVDDILLSLALWRLLLGVGAGGVYPLAAVLSVQQQQQQDKHHPIRNYQQQHINNNMISTTDVTERKVNEQQDHNGDGLFRMLTLPPQVSSQNHHNNDNNENVTIENGGAVLNQQQLHNNYDNDSDHKHNRSINDAVHRVVLTFSMQGAGFMTVPIVALMMLYTFPHQLNVIWRLLLAIGCIPGIVILYLTSQHDSNGTTKRRRKRRGGRRYRHHEPIRTDITNDDEEEDYDDLDGLDISSRSVTIETILNPFDLFKDEQPEEESHTNNPINRDDPLEIRHRLEEPNNINPSPDPIDQANRRDNNNILDASARSNRSRRQRNSMATNATKRFRMTLSKWWESICCEENVTSKFIGTAGTWFLFDVLFYGNTLFQPVVIEAAFKKHESDDPIRLLQQTTLQTFLLTLIALPGYIVAGYVISGSSSHNNIAGDDSGQHHRDCKEPTFVRLLGRACCCCCSGQQTPRYVMLQGFLMMAFLYFVIGILWNTLIQDGTLTSIILLFLYGLTFFFANYGPNTTTFILPSLLYSKRCRSTFNGICAACGKLGAFCGAMLFDRIVQRYGNPSVMILCSGISIVSYIITYLFIPNDQQQKRRQQQLQEPVSSSESLSSHMLPPEPVSLSLTESRDNSNLSNDPYQLSSHLEVEPRELT